MVGAADDDLGGVSQLLSNSLRRANPLRKTQDYCAVRAQTQNHASIADENMRSVKRSAPQHTEEPEPKRRNKGKRPVTELNHDEDPFKPDSDEERMLRNGDAATSGPSTTGTSVPPTSVSYSVRGFVRRLFVR